MGYLSCPENKVWLAASKAICFIWETARTCNSVSHLLKSVVREIRTLRCVGAGTGRPALRPGSEGETPSDYSPQRFREEIEAESVSYLVCKRNGVSPKSESYLAQFVSENMTISDIDLYPVMRAAGQVETLLALTSPTKYGHTKK